MVDPVSLSVLGALALSGGITFLYDQAAEVLKWYRERSDDPGAQLEVPLGEVDVLDHRLTPGPVDLAVVATHRDRLLSLRRSLGDYAEGLADVDPADLQLLEQVAALRALLELAYGQHLTFRGEARPATGSALPADAASTVTHYAATVTASGAGAVAVGRDSSGSISTTMTGGAAPPVGS